MENGVFGDLCEIVSGLESKINLAERLAELEKLSVLESSPDFWSDTAKASKITQSIALHRDFIDQWESVLDFVKIYPELWEMADTSEKLELTNSLDEYWEMVEKLKVQICLNGEFDNLDAIFSIYTGTGGDDAEDFSQILLRMYLRWAEENEFQVRVISESYSDVGLKSATLHVRGPWAYGMLQGEHGVHRLIRISPFNAKGLRQTSFSRVEVIPEIETDEDIQIEDGDIRVDVFRASGNGGQSVNTTDSAVRITYIPLGLSVSCQNEKSQLQNKNTAMKILKSRLLQLKRTQNAEKISDLKGDLVENSFGSQIRSYTLQPYKLVKDHRTNIEHANPEKVFDGDLDIFIQGYLGR